MTDYQNTKEPLLPNESFEADINLLEYLLVIVKHKKMILFACALTFIATCGITLLMPNIYTSTARILPPQESQPGISSMLGGVGDLASLAGLSIGDSSATLYVGMLKSRTVSDIVIKKYQLMKVYDQDSMVETYDQLNDFVTISTDEDDGIISIKVEDEDPARAAEIANTYVEELKRLNIKLNLSRAGRERLFLEKRLSLVKVDLTNAEEALKKFQEKNKTIRIDDQANAIIEALSTFKGELASKEVELGVLLSMQTEQSLQVKALREGINQLKKQISLLEEPAKGKTAVSDIFITTAAVPELAVQYSRLLRDFKVQETLFELLTKQYEMAKITEAKNMSTIQVLDDGVAADKKTKPMRVLIVLLATFIVGFFSVLYAFIREYSQQMGDKDRQIWREIKKESAFKKS